MYKNKNVILDFIATSRDSFALHFTEGLYFQQAKVKVVDRQIIKLNRPELSNQIGQVFSLFYNPDSGQITEILGDHQKSAGACNLIYIGGYLVRSECELDFLIPIGECPRYLREFSNAYGDGYLTELHNKLTDLCRYGCTRFSISFNRDYSKGCEITYDPIKDCDTQEDTDTFHIDLDTQVPCGPLSINPTPTP